MQYLQQRVAEKLTPPPGINRKVIPTGSEVWFPYYQYFYNQYDYYIGREQVVYNGRIVGQAPTGYIVSFLDRGHHEPKQVKATMDCDAVFLAREEAVKYLKQKLEGMENDDWKTEASGVSSIIRHEVHRWAQYQVESERMEGKALERLLSLPDIEDVDVECHGPVLMVRRWPHTFGVMLVD